MSNFEKEIQKKFDKINKNWIDSRSSWLKFQEDIGNTVRDITSSVTELLVEAEKEINKKKNESPVDTKKYLRAGDVITDQVFAYFSSMEIVGINSKGFVGFADGNVPFAASWKAYDVDEWTIIRTEQGHRYIPFKPEHLVD